MSSAGLHIRNGTDKRQNDFFFSFTGSSSDGFKLFRVWIHRNQNSCSRGIKLTNVPTFTSIYLELLAGYTWDESLSTISYHVSVMEADSLKNLMRESLPSYKKKKIQ